MSNEFILEDPGVVKNDDEKVMADLESMTYEAMAINDPEHVTQSIRLASEGAHGSVFHWKSSNPSIITNSGRVIRPKAGEKNIKTDLTLTARSGNVIKTKVYSITVIADEVFDDPGYFTDQLFFGKWDSKRKLWKCKGKLDYEYVSKNGADLKCVEAAVKRGDYFGAKTALLDYMRTRKSCSRLKKDPFWASVAVERIFNLQNSSYYQGEAQIPAEWGWQEIPLKSDFIAKGGYSTYAVTSWYNESSTLQAATRNSDTPPQIILKVNGEECAYAAVKNAQLQAGTCGNHSVKIKEYLEAKMFGNFLGDETSKFLLQFSFKDLKAADVISDVRLCLFARTKEKFAGSKRILVLKEPQNIWSENSVSWFSLNGFVYNYNGLDGKHDWDRPRGADVEYLYQAARFNFLPRVAKEYADTKNEEFAYKIIRIIEDFISDKGAWYPGINRNARGQYPRSLDTAQRLENFISTMDVFSQSPYMTADAVTAILKHMWDMGNSLTVNFAEKGNWRQTEQLSVLNLGLFYPEFLDSRAEGGWFERGKAEQEKLLLRNTYKDGSYIESTGAYSRNAIKNFMNVKQSLIEHGYDVSRKYDDRLHVAAYYASLLRFPDGTSLQYGDEFLKKYKADEFKNISKWYQDKVFEFIDSYGARGTEPEWSSILFPDSRLALMRDNWKTDSPFLFTNVRGGTEGHGHAGDGHIAIYAYGRALLTDSGIFSYTPSDPGRIYGLSTRAHNTVAINDGNQIKQHKGIIDNWQTNKAFDFIREITNQSKGFLIERNILFVKPGFWIVSDFIEPDQSDKINKYQQMWHMYPEANLQFNAEKKSLNSTYSSGPNILLRAAGMNIKTGAEEAFFDRDYDKLEKTRAGYFQLKKAGNTRINTVLLPYKGCEVKLNVDEIENSLGEDASSLRLSIQTNPVITDAYYFLVHRNKANVMRFGPYETNAEMVYISIYPDGKTDQIFMLKGSFVKYADSDVFLVHLEEKTKVYFNKSHMDVTYRQKHSEVEPTEVGREKHSL